MAENNDIFNFLSGEDKKGALPESGGAFANTGFIGPVMPRILFKFWSGEEIQNYTDDFKAGKDYFKTGKSESWFYMSPDYDTAKVMAETLKAFNPSRVWYWELPIAQVQNVDPEKLANWGETINGDGTIKNLTSKKYRHEFHLIMLPALVNALAKMAGFIDTDMWHISEILEGMEDSKFTAGFESKMIGDGDATEDDIEVFGKILDACSGDYELAYAVALGKAETPPKGFEHTICKIPYTSSRLWLRRAALWAALGEPNPEKYIPTGAAETDVGKETLETKSEKLSQCLRASTQDWTQPLWGRLHLLPDPRKEATTKDGKRLTIPMVSELFTSEEAAAKAAQKELAERGITKDSDATPTSAQAQTTAPANSSDEPALPTNWAGYREVWLETLSAQVKAHQEYNGQPLTSIMPPPKQQQVKLMLGGIADEISCTIDDLIAWWGKV